jgi:threonine/homoserine/homoserine lactone efflux protein
MLTAVTTFSLTAALIVLLPGPDTLVTVRSIVHGGRRSGVRAAGGILSGLAVWIVVAVLGLSAVLRASETAYLVLRVVGAAYLVWLGAQAFVSMRRREQLTGVRRGGVLGHGFRAGFLTDLLNPKVGVFFVTFLPGFVPAGHSVSVVSLLLGAIFLVESAAYLAVLVVLSGRVARWMATPRIRRRLDGLMGAVFVGFGARLALES